MSVESVARIHDFNPVDRAILKNLYKKVKTTPKDGMWRTFKGMLVLNARRVLVECDFRLKANFLEIGELKLNFPKIMVVK